MMLNGIVQSLIAITETVRLYSTMLKGIGSVYRETHNLPNTRNRHKICLLYKDLAGMSVFF